MKQAERRVDRAGGATGGCTHRNTTVETLLADGNDNALAIALENLSTRHWQETIHLGAGGIRAVHIGALVPSLFLKVSCLHFCIE